jgi:mRNA interferase HicA
MKRRDLEKELQKLGWKLVRHGSRHDIWSDGEQEEAMPRHNEINELLARKILRKARKK